MWLTFNTGARRVLQLVDRQSIWPAPDGTDAELLITTEAEVIQEVVLVTPKLTRLRYQVQSVEATLTLGDQMPAPWPEAKGVNGRFFELMLTDRGAMLVPGEGPKLPNRLASWLDIVAEDVRSSYPVPPDQISVGAEWETMPSIPGGLPPGTVSAQIKVQHRVDAIEDGRADITTKFGVRVMLEPRTKSHPTKGEGRGEVEVRMSRDDGVSFASRSGRMELIRPQQRNQVLRSTLQLRRV